MSGAIPAPRLSAYLLVDLATVATSGRSPTGICPAQAADTRS
jgi:hypothetical protein